MESMWAGTILSLETMPDKPLRETRANWTSPLCGSMMKSFRVPRFSPSKSSTFIPSRRDKAWLPKTCCDSERGSASPTRQRKIAVKHERRAIDNNLIKDYPFSARGCQWGNYPTVQPARLVQGCERQSRGVRLCGANQLVA